MSDKSHAAMCVYCGEHVIYDTRQVTDMEAAHKQIVEHDQQCPKNPLVAKLAYANDRAERQRHLEAQLQGEINELESESNALAERVAELERYNLGLANESHELKTELRRQAEGGE